MIRRKKGVSIQLIFYVPVFFSFFSFAVSFFLETSSNKRKRKVKHDNNDNNNVNIIIIIVIIIINKEFSEIELTIKKFTGKHRI